MNPADRFKIVPHQEATEKVRYTLPPVHYQHRDGTDRKASARGKGAYAYDPNVDREAFIAHKAAKRFSPVKITDDGTPAGVYAPYYGA